MARVNVYLPDELFAEAKRADLPVSELTQAAVRDALAREAREDALRQFVEALDNEHGPATDEEVADAAAWADAVVAAATPPRQRRKRAAG
jgi:post-segregation antitoxin (ccd killing protein)